MVRASSQQQKTEVELAQVTVNGHNEPMAMEADSTVVTTKHRTTKRKASLHTAAKDQSPAEVAPTRGGKRKLAESPEVSTAVSNGRGHKRAAADATQQPQTKRTKVDSNSAPVIQLSIPAVVGGVVLAVGTGDIGQLGLGPDVEEKTRVALVPGLPDNIVAVSAGGLHSVCLDDQGEVHTWGCNDEGALGRLTSCEDDNFSAGRVEGIEGRVVQVTAGDCHCAALTEHGAVYAWGSFRDNNGPLGFLERDTMQRTPRLVPAGGEGVVRLASGNNHLALLGHSGRLYTCGCGESGQLGRLAEMFASRDSRNRNCFDVLLVPAVVKVYKARRLVLFDDVWAGGDNTFARDRVTGHVYACGLNNYNQMGDIDTNTKFQPSLVKAIKNNKWKQFTCGQHHGLGLESDGTVYCMGRHDYGRLGMGEAHKRDAITPTLVPGLDQVVGISAAGSVSMVVRGDGTALGFGMGTSNQLSQGNDDDCWEPTQLTGKQLTGRRVVAVSVGGQHSVLLAVPAL